MDQQAPCFGYCASCDKVHELGVGPAREEALALFATLKQHGRLDYDVPLNDSNPLFTTDSLYGFRCGQMFGVLVGEDAAGNSVVLKAFSSQQNGEWIVPGWAPPLVDAEEYLRIVRAGGEEIAVFTAKMEGLDRDSRDYDALRTLRREYSQRLMRQLHGMYRLHNFRGEVATLEEAFILDKGMPTGVGDCCAPKLLNQAAQLGLRPLGIAEFFLGRDTLSGGRTEGEFYPVCVEKCQPIMGFLLCGVEQ